MRRAIAATPRQANFAPALCSKALINLNNHIRPHQALNMRPTVPETL